jgi:hypothetical protein
LLPVYVSNLEESSPAQLSPHRALACASAKTLAESPDISTAFRIPQFIIGPGFGVRRAETLVRLIDLRDLDEGFGPSPTRGEKNRAVHRLGPSK